MPQLRKIAIKSADFTTALAFLTNTLGVDEKFSDGDGYAELDTSLGLAVLSEQHYPEGATGEAALFVKVDAVGAAATQLEAAGASRLGAVVEGEHEFRGVLSLPGTSLALVLYGPER